MADGLIPRPSARVLMIDDADRLLLFSVGDRAEGSLRWFPPGGGVEPGESHEQAAVREVREETGLADVALSREVWRGRPWVSVREGVEYEFHQRYFMARVPVFDVDTSGFEDVEKASITGFRWWTMAELAATDEDLRPAELAGLVARLLVDGLPDEPITVAG